MCYSQYFGKWLSCGFFFSPSIFSPITWPFEALTCSRSEDGLSCRHGVKPPLTHECHVVRCLCLTLFKHLILLPPPHPHPRKIPPHYCPTSSTKALLIGSDFSLTPVPPTPGMYRPILRTSMPILLPAESSPDKQCHHLSLPRICVADLWKAKSLWTLDRKWCNKGDAIYTELASFDYAGEAHSYSCCHLWAGPIWEEMVSEKWISGGPGGQHVQLWTNRLRHLLHICHVPWYLPSPQS